MAITPNYGEEWKLVDRFDSAYWSGLDVQIFADNIYLDEAIQVNYTISEQTRPYYGYASYVPDRIYHGSRLIHGELSLNFKRDHYLFSLLNQLRGNPSLSIPQFKDNDPSVQPAALDLSWERLLTGGIDPNIVSAAVAKNRSSLSAFREETITIPNNQGIFETSTQGFNLSVVFGANLNSAKALRFLSDGTHTLEDSYAIGATIQTETAVGTIGTGIRLIGVEIMGSSRAVNDDGRPIIETYSFQAKNVEILKSIDKNNFTDSSRVLKSVVDTGDSNSRFIPFPGDGIGTITDAFN